jgi:general secretion pathway protein D
MPRAPFIFVAGLLAAALALPALASADDRPISPPISCSNGIVGSISCIASKQDRKEAHNAFARGMKLQDRGQFEAAFTQFDQASRLVPQDRQFLTARELLKAKLVFSHIERGNALLMDNARPQAANEFRAAADLDPENEFARERLEEATRAPTPLVARNLPAQLTDAGEIRIEPAADRATFHYSGDVRGLFNELAAAYRVKVQFDESLQNKQLVFDVDDLDFFTAVKLACQISKTMWAPLDAHQFLIATDNADSHRQFDHMSLQKFLLPPHSQPSEATEVVNTLRTMFDLRFITSGQTSGTVEIRAPLRILEACGKLLDQLNSERPQVMLEVRIFQINHQLARNIGLHVPNTFNLFNIPAGALAALGGQNIQDLINQLIASGGINQAGGTSLSALLAQLGGQGNNIFSQPLTTFGGGLTFMGLSLDQLTTSLSTNESWVRSLEHMTLRAGQGSDATFHLGERYPILNASYAPIFNSPAIAKVLGNNSYVPPFPSVSYEDLGLSVKAKPIIHGGGDVSLQLELEVRSLTGQSSDGVPVISNREYKGSISLKDGEPAYVAGEISKSDSIAMSGIPGFGAFPGLNNVMVNNTKSEESDELMIVITPHVLANGHHDTEEIWISEK